MRKPLLYLCMTACLMLFTQTAMAGGVHAGRDNQGPNTPWGSYTETGRNTPWGSYSDMNRQHQNDQRDRQYGRDGRDRHHDNQGYENCNYRQTQARDQDENRTSTGCRPYHDRTDNMKRDAGRDRSSGY